MGLTPVQEYETNMNLLIGEYKALSFDLRKKRFTEYVRKEAEMFARAIDNAHINNITRQDYDIMMQKRNQYVRQMFEQKDVCAIF